MWKLLSKASLAAAATALAVTTLSVPANAQVSSPVDTLTDDPTRTLGELTSLVSPRQASEDGQQAPTTKQGTPVPLPRPVPEGVRQEDAPQLPDESIDAGTLPKNLVDQLPESGVLPPELTGQVQDVLGDRLEQVGAVELPTDRRLTTGPNGDLMVVDREDLQPDGVVSGDRPNRAQPEVSQPDVPTANLGPALQSLLQPQGPLAGLQGLNGGLPG